MAAWISSVVDGRPYVDPKKRPSYRKGVADKTFENAKVNGVVRDPYTNEAINWKPGQSRNGVWDMGHLPEHKYSSEVHQRYLNREMTPKEFRNWFNTPENYRPELPSTNRSHVIE